MGVGRVRGDDKGAPQPELRPGLPAWQNDRKGI